MEKKGKNLYMPNYTPQLKVLYTIIRNKNTKREDFIFYANRIIRILIEEALNLLPTKNKKIITPTKTIFNGAEFKGKICTVSIMRAGDAMIKPIREVCKDIRVGKILIQRNEKTALPTLYYSKLPLDIKERYVLLMDPMLATGGSSCKAIDLLKKKGVRENKIIFINLISCPEGIKKVRTKFPDVKIVTGFIDKKLNDKAFIVPGLGDFGDRYFGTE